MKDISQYADAHLRIFERPDVGSLGTIQSVYLIGICGTGMGSLAGLLKEKGYNVRGSDAAAYPPMSTRLAAMDIDVIQGFDASNLKVAPDLIVVGNACTPTHVEAAYARNQGLPQVSMPEAVRHFFLTDRKPIVAAGTHGKTTTTGLIIHILTQNNLDPGYLVGGVMRETNKSFAVGTGEYFVVEGDEYDSAYFDKRPKFEHYMPHVGIVTSMELDHVDIYEDFEDYFEAFRNFAALIGEDGTLILNSDSEHVASLQDYCSGNVVTYGFEQEANVSAHGMAPSNAGQSFNLLIEGSRICDVNLPMNGRHNASNALAAIAAAMSAGVDPRDAADSLASFVGLKRRQEIILEAGGITVIDDFAHHPTAVAETVQAIRQRFGPRRITAVFEPRSNSSRRKVFEHPYILAFQNADRVLISSPPFRHNDDRSDFMNVETMVHEMNGNGIDAAAFDDFEQLFSALSENLTTGDVVLIMSNGGFNNIHRRLKDFIRQLNPANFPRLSERVKTT